ncbi:MAG: hypothetical protein R2883_00900 [Caldisericia bacterium]
MVGSGDCISSYYPMDNIPSGAVLTPEEQKIIESDARLRKIESDYYQYVLSKEKHICPVCGTPIF